jgi:hypothetical protein
MCKSPCLLNGVMLPIRTFTERCAEAVSVSAPLDDLLRFAACAGTSEGLST